VLCCGSCDTIGCVGAVCDCVVVDDVVVEVESVVVGCGVAGVVERVGVAGRSSVMLFANSSGVGVSCANSTRNVEPSS
jgi:hypothetical protein